MIFNKHLNLEGDHAFLGASRYHWINYDEEKLSSSYIKFLAIEKGTKLHAFARNAIELGIKLPKSGKTLHRYVNDAIGFRMQPEQVLYYSENAFGTADAISFKNGLLRIHDLKTGITPVSIHQLEVYAALFCLEYNFKPRDIDAELRIYQNDDVLVNTPETDRIDYIMDKIMSFDKLIEKMKLEGQ